MTKPRRVLSYLAEYEFADANLLTATYHEEARIRNAQRIIQAQSVLDTHEDDHRVNNAKRIQQEQDRKSEISHHNLLLLDRLEKIHYKVPKRFDVSHHSEELLSAPRPSNFPSWRREQERIAAENKKMKRRLHQAKATFDTKQLAADAEKHRYFGEQLSKAERRMHVRQHCMQLEGQAAIKRVLAGALAPSPSEKWQRHHGHRHRRRERGDPGQSDDQDKLQGVHECRDPNQGRKNREPSQLPVVRQARAADKYAPPQESFPTVTNTTKCIRAADLLPRLARIK